MTKTLITGISGFTGNHLAQYLITKGEQVFGFGLPSELPFPKQVTFHEGDIRDQATLKQIIEQIQPEVIYHLAGLIKATDLTKFYEINVLGTVILFEAIIESGLKPKVLVTSSSAVYGKGVGKKLITEQFQLRPMTHYAVSKVAQETVAQRYYLAHGLPVVCTRAFNLVGPAQPPTLACSAFAHQIALAEQSEANRQIVIGDLSSQRDFLDVRDAVQAYDMIANSGTAGQVYNVCSQKAVSIKHCLDILLEMARVPVEVKFDPARLQASDVPVQVGSATRLFHDFDWQPTITLEQSLADLLNYWREEISN
jgi:GDP-4-dehydro-6-deoxy-D-mannose reductase